MAQQVGGVFIGLDLAAQGFNTKFDSATKKITSFSSLSNAQLTKIAAQSKLTVSELQKINTLNLSRAGASISTLSTGLRALRGLAASAGIGLGAAGVQQLVDATTRIDNALKAAGLSGENLDKVYEALYRSSQRHGAGIESLVQLYGRAAQVQKELGVNTNELLKFTDNIALALRVSGKSAMESSGALLQLSQALGSGTVRAQEFNSMLEGALPIVQAAAAGIKEAVGSVSKLRQLVNEGKVSSAAFFRGFEAGAVILQDKVANAQLTVAQGFTKIHNAAIDAARRINETAGVSGTAASALEGLAVVVNKLGDALVYLAKQGGETGTTKSINDIGAAARNLVNDPSFERLYQFLFDTSKSSAQAAITDGIHKRAEAIDLLRASMRRANEDIEKGAATSTAVPNKRIDDAFAAFAPKKVSLDQFPVTGTSKKDSSAATTANAEADAFTRAADAIARRTAVMQADLATTGLSEAARERARVVAEMEVAAIRANTAAGLENTSVTESQRAKIEELANAYENVRGRIEAANSPLEQWIRSSQNVKENLEGIAVSGLDRIADEFAEVTSGAKTAGQAMEDLSKVVIKEVQKMIVKLILAAILKAFIGGGKDGGLVGMSGIGGLGGLGGGVGGLLDGGFGFKNGGMVNIAHAPTIRTFVGGGPVSGPGGPRSDSVLARLSDGEFVVNAASTKRHRALLEAINSGFSLNAGMPAFANGGSVGLAASAGDDTPYIGKIGGKGKVLDECFYH